MSPAPASQTLVDVTELIQNPISTGVQRVVRSLLQHWPDPDQLILCRYTQPHGLVVTPPSVMVLLRDALVQYAGLSIDELRLEIARNLGSPEPISKDQRILVPEVFFDLGRCEHHAWILEQWAQRTFFIVHDFIPWLHPDVIGVQESAKLMPYIRLLRRAERVGFTSNNTRQEFVTRITRRSGIPGPVLGLGADGPCTPRQEWSPTRDTYLSIGSIDGRKNQGEVIQAFEQLWKSGSTAKLTIVGRVFDSPHVQELAETLARLNATQPLFNHVFDVSDEEMNALYARVRACIYVSEIEGFGLPPVESLHCGTPVIVHHKLPSIESLPQDGQIRLEIISPATIAGAVRVLQNDNRAKTLWTAAARIQTKTWKQVATEVAAWMQAS